MDGFLKVLLLLVTTPSASWAQTNANSLIIPSFVLHGFQPVNNAAGAMPRKILSNGDAVMTPGFGIESISASGLLFLSAVVKDCYDNLAGTLQIGKDYRLSRESHLSISMGVYVRQTPLECDPKFNPDGGCTLRDHLSARFVKKINNQWIDVIPMPFLHYSYSFYKDKDLEIRGKVIANFFVNEVGLEIPF